MKKMIAALLLIAMLIQVLPFEALATVGKVLSKEELARAYALTGLGTGGLKANSNGAYHDGMKPNASWNASQLDDWLEEKLSKDLNSLTDLISQVMFALEELKQDNPSVWAKYEAFEREYAFIETIQKLSIDAEVLRQTLRWHQDRLTAASNTIAEMSRYLEEEGSGLFDSDKVRYSARIEKATAEITEVRQTIADSASGWEAQIEQLQDSLMGIPTTSEGNPGNVGGLVSMLLSESGEPQTNSVSVSRVSPNASLANRLSGAAGLVANDVADAKITVITENEVAIVLQAGTVERPVPVEGAKVSVDDALNDSDPVVDYYSNSTGTVVLPVNLFRMDEYDVLHLRLKVDPTAQGYRDYAIQDLDLEKGEIFTNTLTPIDGAVGNAAGSAASNAEGDPYVYSMSFETKDIMHHEYDMIYSPMNDYEFEIKVEVRNTEGKNLPDLLMRYYSYKKNDPSPSFDKMEECWASPTRKEGDTYIFKGKWKQLFAPKASMAQRPTFMFGKDAPASLTFPSQLAAQQSATEKPLNEGTGPNGGIFANVLGEGLGFSFTIPVVDIKVNVKLPFQDYLPKLSVDLGGYVVIYMGMPVFEDSIKKLKGNWQSNDLRVLKQAQKLVERKGMLANYKAQYNMAKEFYKSKLVKFFGQSQFNVGIFAVLTGRWELDEDIPNVTSKNVSLKGGFGVTLSYSFSWTVSYAVGPVPLYLGFTLGVSAGFAVEISVSFCIVNGEFRNWSLNFGVNITITIGFMFSAQFGVGVEGFLDAWVRLSATLNFMLRLSIADLSLSSFTISGSIDLSVGATVFFVTISKTWNIIHGQIWPNGNANLLEHYMNAGVDDEAKTVEAVSDEPQRYPALTPEMEEVASTSDKDDAGTEYKIIRVGGRTLMFCIQQIAHEDNPVRRVFWRCLNADTDSDGFWNNLEEIINSSDEYDNIRAFLPRNDYDFDVYSDDRFVYLVITSAKNLDENGYPTRNDLSTPSFDDLNMGIYYVVMEHDGKGQLRKPNLTTRYGDSSIWHHLYSGYAFGQGQDHRYLDITYPKYSYDSYIKPKITLAAPDWDDEANNKINCFQIYGQCETIHYPEDDTVATGTTGFAINELMYLFTDKTVKTAMGDSYERVQTLDLMDLDTQFLYSDLLDDSPDGYAMSFVGLSKPKGGAEGDSAIELYPYDMNRAGGDRIPIVLEKGDIEHIALVEERLSREWKKSGRTVFYTMREKSDDGVVRNRLHGLYLAPVENAGVDHSSYQVTRYTYDAVIPSGQFDICYIGGAPYLYWVSTAEKRKDSDPDVWRVWTMCYDPVANTMTDPSVFAEFTIPKIHYSSRDKWGSGYHFELNAAPGSVVLTGTGTAYVNAIAADWQNIPEDFRPKLPPTSLFSFKELLTPSVNLTAAIPRQLAVKAGDFEDVTLGLRNEGNLAISTMDVAMVEVVDGVEAENPTSIVHINAKDPEKSKVTYTAEANEVVLEGRQAAYREEDYDITPRKRDWVLDQQTTQYTLSIGDSVGVDARVTEPSAPRYVKTDILFPGSTGAFMGAFKIPESWHGEKTLRMKVTKATVESNLARAVANAAGLATNAPESATLEYVLNEKTGKLELQAPVQANAAVKNAVASGLYANEIDTSSADMLIHVQDVEVKHRIYQGLGGERMLDIVVHNHAATRARLTLSCAVYVDGSSDPYILNLPYYNKTSSRRTQTITLPVSALVDDVTRHKSARVVITAVGADERAYANNEFSVYFDGEDPLRFTKQPEDQTVQEGEAVSFSVEVGGGAKPYAYQWQVWDEKHQKWVDLPGFTESTLSREDIEKKWDGCRFRCVVTDATGAQIISREVTLHVRDRVPTGDGSNLPLYLSVALMALAMLWWMRRRRRAA